MIFKNRYKRKHLSDKYWHAVFAWKPVRVNPREIAWLEWVERRVWVGLPGKWEYRKLGGDE